MQTGNRWAGKSSPRDLTARRQQQLLKEHAAREAAANEVIDLPAIKQRAYAAGHSAGWDDAITWIVQRMVAVGLDPDVLAMDDDEHLDDE